MFKTCMFFFFSFFMAVLIYGQNVRFSHLSLKDGLSQSSIRSMVQDDQGFMWFGTESGLNKYNGYNFKIYFESLEDSNSISNNTSNYIFKDEQSIFWIGTEKGLTQFDLIKEKFTRYYHNPDDPKSISNDRVFSILRDSKGELWVGTENGLNKFNPQRGNFIHFKNNPDDPNSLSNNCVTKIYEDKAGNLWIGTNGGGLNIYNRESKQFHRLQYNPRDPRSLSNNNVLSIYEDKSATLWIGTEKGGLNKYNQKEKNFVHFKHNPNDPTSIGDNHINVIHEDREGVLWIGTNSSGVNIFDRERNIFKRFLTNADDPYSLGSNRVISIYEDYTGAVWIGAYGGALNIYNRITQKFAHYKSEANNPNSLSYSDVRPIYEDHEGIIWIGTDGGGLNRFDRKKQEFKSYKHTFYDSASISDNKVFAISEDQNGGLWVGTQGGGLNKLDRKTGKFTHFRHDPNDSNSLVSDVIRSIQVDHSGIIWIGTNGGGLSQFNPKTENFKNYKHDPDKPNTISNNRIYSMYVDRANNLWLASYSGGLSKLNPQRDKFTHYKNITGDPKSLSNDFVLAIYEDEEGYIWAGTSAGLNKLDPHKETFTTYLKKDGLPDDVIYDVVADASGDLWVSTNKGLSRFHPKDLEFKNYDMKDGLQSNEFNTGTGRLAKNGDMFFGGINGFNVFRPEQMIDNPYMPPIVVTNFTIFNKHVPIGKEEDGRVILEKSITHTNNIELSYTDKVFSFEYAALHYASPEKNKYAYMIEGFEDTWNYVGNRRFVSYTGLPPGDYIFRVKGSNNDGLWNEEGASINITITPPFWQTTWFLTLALILINSLAYAGYRYRVRRITAQREYLKKQVRKKTKELNIRNKNLRSAKKETDNILKHVKDGLFLLDNTTNIESQYSAALEKILEEKDLGKKSFLKYLNNKIGKENVENVKNYLDLLLDKNIDEETLSELNPLSEIEFDFADKKSKASSSKFLTFEFRRIFEDEKIVNIIATVNDITEKIHLEKDLELTRIENKRKLDIMLCILNVDPVMLSDFLKTTHDELLQIESLTNDLKRDKDNSSQLNVVSRLVHNIKGNSSLLELEFFANKAHLVENNIQELTLSDKIKTKDINDLKREVKSLISIQDEIKEFINQIGKVKDQFKSKLKNDHHALIDSLSKLIDNLSNGYQKKTKLVTEKFKGEVIPDSHRLLVRDVLVQLVRNSMYHGIENEDERKEKGKKPSGTIEIENFMQDGNFVLLYKDDGRGIDLEKLREKALETGNWAEDEIADWDNQDLADLIYTPGLTTAEKVTVDAGRGFGMDIIKNKILAHKGSIDFEFDEDKYCNFSIILPLN